MTLEMLQLIGRNLKNKKIYLCSLRLLYPPYKHHMKKLLHRKFGIPGGYIELLCKAISSVITWVGYVTLSLTFFTHLKNEFKLSFPASVVSTFSIASEAELTYGQYT